MSATQRTSAALRIFVPLYLLVIGLGLLVGTGALLVYSPDELFVAILAAFGGLTMLGTLVALLTVARNR